MVPARDDVKGTIPLLGKNIELGCRADNQQQDAYQRRIGVGRISLE
jgi:hypothetical protein